MVPRLPTEQLSASPPRKTLQQRGIQDKPWRTHADRGSRTASAGRAVWAVTCTAAGARLRPPAVPEGRCAACHSAPAAGPPECAEISPGEALNRYRNSSVSSALRSLVTEVGLAAQKPGITQPNRLHSSYWEPLEMAAPPMKVQSHQQTTFLGSVSSRQPHCSPWVRSNH